MKRQWHWKSRRTVRMTSLVLFCAFGAQVAQAQYGTSFYYHNPKTGRTYAQNVGVGNHSAYGGFYSSNNGRSYSAGSGYYGNHYYQHQNHYSPQRFYSHHQNYGRGYHYGRSSYGSYR